MRFERKLSAFLRRASNDEFRNGKRGVHSVVELSRDFIFYKERINLTDREAKLIKGSRGIDLNFICQVANYEDGTREYIPKTA